MSEENQTAKEKLYKEHDWEADDKWQEYFKHIYPVPVSDKLEKLKRRWYKIYEDIEFDVDPPKATLQPKEDQTEQEATTIDEVVV